MYFDILNKHFKNMPKFYADALEKDGGEPGKVKAELKEVSADP